MREKIAEEDALETVLDSRNVRKRESVRLSAAYLCRMQFDKLFRKVVTEAVSSCM